MNIAGFVNRGFDGDIVRVEVDLRRGIPGVDIVGLPDSAVREARERVRVAIRNSGFDFPRERVLINLAPAGIRKEGASFDLSIAAGILFASGQLSCSIYTEIMFLGELELSGHVRGVNGVLSAVSRGMEAGIKLIFVPSENLPEAVSVYSDGVVGIESLKHIMRILDKPGGRLNPGHRMNPDLVSGLNDNKKIPDFSDIKGHKFLKRALEIAACGGHHVFMFGPPGSGKTMAALRFSGILPDLLPSEAVEVSRIYSLGGLLGERKGCTKRPPVRMPHHTASREGLIGGGRDQLPGEISLAHRGVLFLDETPEFSKSLLQSLREPLERGRIDIARSEIHYWYPARFQLLLAANPCPCGSLGKQSGSCMCSLSEISRYWKKMGGALLDRIDIRIPVQSVSSEKLIMSGEENTLSIRTRIEKGVAVQRERFSECSYSRNSGIPVQSLMKYCSVDEKGRIAFTKASRKLGLSSRAAHSVLRVARTIADLEESELIKSDHILEAVQHRRYGDGDFFWRR